MIKWLNKLFCFHKFVIIPAKISLLEKCIKKAKDNKKTVFVGKWCMKCDYKIGVMIGENKMDTFSVNTLEYKDEAFD